MMVPSLKEKKNKNFVSFCENVQKKNVLELELAVFVSEVSLRKKELLKKCLQGDKKGYSCCTIVILKALIENY